MKSIITGIYFFIFIFLHYSNLLAQDITDNHDLYDDYYDFGTTSGITIFRERPREFAPESIEYNVLSALNGLLPERKNFIENDLLRDAGFRRSGNVRFRRTRGSEKAKSVLHGAASLLSFGIIPMKPFLEIDYGQLPKGEYYSFDSVIHSSELRNISPDVLAVMEIEYMLQIEFLNGILTNSNRNYYTEENINKFEMLILRLPEFPEDIRRLKDRYLNVELPRIRHSFERYNNPSENHLRALENLRDIF